MHLKETFEHLKVPLEAIKLATNNFGNENCIGGGGFGKVYKGHLAVSGVRKIVAFKRLDSKFGQGNPEFWKEIITLSLYKHENIVSLLGFCDEGKEKILIYEYASRGSLDFYLNNDDLMWIQRLKICIGAARGLAYLHDPGSTQQRVLHRDIKSSNILLDESWNASIADLGLSKFGPANQQYTFLVSNAVGTIGYCDPLYVESGLLTKESDVYSFGVVLFEVLCGRLCIYNNGDKRRPLTGLVRQYYEEDNLNKIIHANIKDEITSNSLQEFSTIAYQCLSRDLKRRPKMSEVVTKLEKALQYQVNISSTSTSNYEKDDALDPYSLTTRIRKVNISSSSTSNYENENALNPVSWLTRMWNKVNILNSLTSNPEYESDEDQYIPRARGRPFDEDADTWAGRMREKYGLDVSEFTYIPSKAKNVSNDAQPKD